MHTLCLLAILIAAKGSGIAQLRYQKREKAVIFLTFSREGGGVREKRKIDVSCGKNRYVRLPLVYLYKPKPQKVVLRIHI